MSFSLRLQPWVAGCLLAACASTPDPNTEYVGRVGYPSGLAQRHYVQARAAWLAGYEGEFEGGLVAALASALEKLRLAAELDRQSPLYLSKRADLLLRSGLGEQLVGEGFHSAVGEGALGRADLLAEAEGGYLAALLISEDWIPAHLGLAHIALLRDRLEEALEHTERAKRGIERLKGLLEKDPSFLELVFRMDLSRTEGHDAMSAEPSIKERRQILLGYLGANEGWRLDQLDSASGSALGAADVTRRLLAWTAFYRGQVFARARELGEPEAGVAPDLRAARREVLRGIDAALGYDKDIFELRLAQVETMAAMGDPKRACDILQLYLDQSEFPLIAQLPGTLTLGARLRSEEFRLFGDLAASEQALEWLSRLIDPRPEAELSLARALRAELRVARALHLEPTDAARAFEEYGAAREDLGWIEARTNRLRREGRLSDEQRDSLMADILELSGSVSRGLIHTRAAHDAERAGGQS